jgi:hypothetical protein
MTLRSIDFGRDLDAGTMLMGGAALLIAVKRGHDSGNPAWQFGDATTFAEVRERFGMNTHIVSGIPIEPTPFQAAVRVDEAIDAWLEARDGTSKVAEKFAPVPVTPPKKSEAEPED